MDSSWKYYNHALIPNCAPHEIPNLDIIYNKSIWKNDFKNAIFARWTTDYDKIKVGNWWYIVLDKSFELDELKARYRYKIKKGLSNFKFKKIRPEIYAEKIAEITINAWKNYPIKYRPKTDDKAKKELINEYENCKNLIFGAFNKDNDLCAYFCLEDNNNYWSIGQYKIDPLWEQNYNLNAGMIYTINQFLKDDINNGKYITNGMRNTLHQTNFNEDLCRIFNFRKVYCKLHVEYNPKFKFIFKIAYPFRNIIKRLGKLKIFNYLYTILEMDEISRT